MGTLFDKSLVRVGKAERIAGGAAGIKLEDLNPEVPGLFRLETDPRGDAYDEALAARLADPLWMLARQWQFREFDGEDAGSPLEVQYRLEGTPVVGYAPGLDPSDDSFVPLGAAPLEALVEAEPVLGSPSGHARANLEAGQVLLRMLDDAGFDVGAALRLAYPGMVAQPFDPPSDPAGTLWHLVLAGRGVDATTLASDLRSVSLDADGIPAQLPQPLIDAGAPDAVRPVLADWLRWMAEFVHEPPGRNAAWSPQRQEYAFELAAGRGERQRWRLDAQEYVDGRVDAHDFDLRDGARTLLAGDAGTFDDVEERRSIATPVQYPGMPATRFWEFEDAAVNFASLDAGSLDLVRMMLAEYALVHGNDWFMVPARVRAGGLYRVASLRVTDTFGIVTAVEPVPTHAQAAWRLQGLSHAKGGAAVDAGWVFVPPPMSDTLEGNPLEEVAFARDEMANLAWAVEKRVQGTSGEPLDRSLEDQRYSIRQQPTVPSTDARLLYRLMTPVPSHWLPLLPTRVKGNLGLGIQLERGGMKRFYRQDAALRAADPGYAAFLDRLAATAARPDGFVESLASSDPDIVVYAFHPRGLVLRSDPSRPVSQDGLRLDEEELSRAGFVVERRFQYARSADGRAWLWVGRRKRIGRGEAASGLAFDCGLRAGSR